MSRYRFPLGLFLSLLTLWVLAMGAELYALRGIGSLSTADAHRMVSSLSRSHNQLVSVVLVSVALAIPITAANYGPKLLRLFLTDRIHLSVLTTYALAAVHANWVMFLARDGAVSGPQVASVMLSCGIGFTLVVPYFFYVIWFVEPTTLIARIKRLGLTAVRFAAARPSAEPWARVMLADALHNLGSLVLKAVAGLGRQTAATGIYAMRELLAAYGEAKPRLGGTWFSATKSEFRGLSREALQFISADRCWVEVVALQDLNTVFEAAIASMPDAVVSVADTLRGIGVDAHARNDVPVVDNVIRTFNTMVRSAITHREPHAIFDVLNQYRALTEECMAERPELAVEVARYLSLYSARCRRAGFEFIPELFAYDVGSLLREAAESRSPSAHGLIDVFVQMMGDLGQAPTVPLACSGLTTIGAVIDELESAQVDRIVRAVVALPDGVVDAGLGVLERAESPRYHELTARQIDLNFLPPPTVDAVRARVLAARAG